MITLYRYLTLFFYSIVPTSSGGLISYGRRLLILIPAMMVFVLIQCVHCIGFLLDEIFFPRYRQVQIQKPIFILGVPRSGTTFMHRVLASNPELTAPSLAECIFAPSITERHCYAALARLEKYIRIPDGGIKNRFLSKLKSSLENIHPTGLTLCEEDYLFLLPTLDCFLLVLAFPNANWLWQLAKFDENVPLEEKSRFLKRYHRALQRHLYYHGNNVTLVSKNASFNAVGSALASRYADARFIICKRDSVTAINSQFRSIKSSMQLIGNDCENPRFTNSMAALTRHYYECLEALSESLSPKRILSIPLSESARQPDTTFERIHEFLGLHLHPATLRSIQKNQQEQKLAPPVNVRESSDITEIERLVLNWRQTDTL